MDPISIAASSAGLAVTCVKISALLYTWIEETRNVDTAVSDFCEETIALSRVLDTISKSLKQSHIIVASTSGANQDLWSSLKATLDDCGSTLDKLDQKLEEVKGSAPSGLAMLRRPIKHFRLSLKIKDIALFRERIQFYNGAMQLPLQMINVYRSTFLTSYGVLVTSAC
jgi:Fungal N-terminal domain of STAND proteins